VDQVERRFHQDMVAIYETAKRELGYQGTCKVDDRLNV
jgi:hypothetical protein